MSLPGQWILLNDDVPSIMSSFGTLQTIMAGAGAGGRIVVLMPRTAGVTSTHVVNHAAVIDQRAVNVPRCSYRQGDPAGEICLRKPQMIRAKKICRIGVAEHDDALARLARCREQIRETCWSRPNCRWPAA